MIHTWKMLVCDFTAAQSSLKVLNSTALLRRWQHRFAQISWFYHRELILTAWRRLVPRHAITSWPMAATKEGESEKPGYSLQDASTCGLSVWKCPVCFPWIQLLQISTSSPAVSHLCGSFHVHCTYGHLLLLPCAMLQFYLYIHLYSSSSLKFLHLPSSCLSCSLFVQHLWNM